MPMPKPADDEEREEFLERCMGNDVMNEEYPDNEQRYAVCNSLWRDRKMADIEHKSTRLELKEGDEGTFTARIATLMVVDSDGDLTKSGAFPEGKELLVSAYMHGSWMGALPVGKAVIHEDGDEVIAEGSFNLSTETGKEHYEAVKFTGDLQEWSYGFLPLKWEDQTIEGQKVRVLTKVDPFEISPVLKGAGVGTATLAIKSENDGLSFADQMEAALAAVNNMAERSKSLADLRRQEGRVFSAANREGITKLLDSLTAVSKDLQFLLEDTEPKAAADIQRLFLDYARISNELVGGLK